MISEQENIVLFPCHHVTRDAPWRIITNILYKSAILNFFTLPIVTTRDTILYGGQILDHCFVMSLDQLVFHYLDHEGELFLA